MTTKTWDAFFPFVLPSVPGCDDDTATFHIRQGAIDFCKNSQALRQEIPITTTACVSDYVVPWPTDLIGSTLVSFTLIDTDGIPDDEYDVVSPAVGRDLDRNFTDACYAYLSDDGTTLHISPPPDDDAMTALPFFALKPTQAAAGVPAWLFEEYASAIAAQAMGALLALPKKPWGDAGLAAAMLTMADQKSGAASVRESRGKSRARTRSKAFLY